MVYIQIPQEYNAQALWLLFMHSPTKCFPTNIYAVSDEQVQVLTAKGIPFKQVDVTKMQFPKPLAHNQVM